MIAPDDNEECEYDLFESLDSMRRIMIPIEQMISPEHRALLDQLQPIIDAQKRFQRPKAIIRKERTTTPEVPQHKSKKVNEIRAEQIRKIASELRVNLSDPGHSGRKVIENEFHKRNKDVSHDSFMHAWKHLKKELRKGV